MAKKIQMAARIILGLIYFVFGSMGLAIALGFMKMPDQSMPEAAETFVKGIMATGYFFPVLKITETVFGFLLFFKRTAPLALVVLAPVTLQIMLFHTCLTPGAGNLILPYVMGVLHIIAMCAYGNLYQPLYSNRR